jgi:hypothetical protein
VYHSSFHAHDIPVSHNLCNAVSRFLLTAHNMKYLGTKNAHFGYGWGKNASCFLTHVSPPLLNIYMTESNPSAAFQKRVDYFRQTTTKYLFFVFNYSHLGFNFLKVRFSISFIIALHRVSCNKN